VRIGPVHTAWAGRVRGQRSGGGGSFFLILRIRYDEPGLQRKNMSSHKYR